MKDDIRSRAVELHGNQLYGEKYPYVIHLDSTWAFMERFSYLLTEEELEIVKLAIPCHDLLEDTDLTKEDLGLIIGKEATDIVYRVSDEEGKNRKERKEKTYPKMMGHKLATFVKLCDRLANVSFGYALNSREFSMYREENREFVDKLYLEHLDKMFCTLDELFELH